MKKKLKIVSYITGIIRFINQYNRLYICISVISLVVIGVLPIVSIHLTQMTINAIQRGSHELRRIVWLLVLICLLNILQAIINEAYSYYNVKVTLNLSRRINIMMLEKSARLELSDFENPQTFDRISRAQNQTGSQILAFVTELFSVFQQLATAIATIWMIANFRWWLIILCVTVPVIRFFVSVRISKEQYNMRYKRTQKERKCGYIKYLFSTTEGMEELKIFQFTKRRIRQYSDLQKEFIKQDLTIEKKNNILIITTEVLATAVSGVCMAYCVLEAFFGRILLGDVIAYIDYIEKINESIENIFADMQQMVSESLYVRLLVDFLEMPEEKIRDQKIERIQTIEFRNVSFGYGNNLVLKNVNFRFQSGDFIKIVGINGSGKTTLLKLLMGIYDDYDGQILINDSELKDINRESYYEHLGCVFQNYEKYEDTIATNITCDDSRYSKKEILRNADSVGLLKKIESIGGLNTIVGHWFGEHQLSDGEWQKIAVARALIRNSDFLILDEPDAALDSISAKRIHNELLHKVEIRKCIAIKVSHKTDENDVQYTGIYRLQDGTLIMEK